MEDAGSGFSRTSTKLAIAAVHVCCAALLMWWSWRKWPDPLIDFGRELYVPWQITRGKVLYRDIASLFGPLSPYVNALWFRLFGVSLLTLAVCNFAILGLIVAGIYHLIRISTDRLTATAAGLSTLVLFGFSQYGDVGNYNFITPYSHEATHGFALGVAAIVAFVHAVTARRRMFFAISGLAVGLTALTKPETAIAAFAALLAAWIVRLAIDGADLRRLVLDASASGAGAALPVLGFFVYFLTSAGLPPGDAGRAIATAFRPAVATSIASNVFYLRTMGLDDPARNVLRMFRIFAAFVVFVGVAVAWARTGLRGPIGRLIQLTGEAALIVAGALLAPRFELLRALPIVAVAAAMTSGVVLTQSRSNRAAAAAPSTFLMWSVFAGALLAKMGLNAHIYQYGFFLALPATTVVIAVVLWMIPRLVDERIGVDAGTRVRWIMGGTLVLTIGLHVVLAAGVYRSKTVSVGSGADRILASDPFLEKWRGLDVPRVLDRLAPLVSPDRTLVVLPEGVMLNYLLRRETPIPFVTFMPPEVAAFTEDAMAQALQRHPPDVIVFVHRDTSEYGLPLFGSAPEYGRTIMDWVRAHYSSVDVIGRDPMSASGYGFEILRRQP